MNNFWISCKIVTLAQIGRCVGISLVMIKNFFLNKVYFIQTLCMGEMEKKYCHNQDKGKKISALSLQKYGGFFCHMAFFSHVIYQLLRLPLPVTNGPMTSLALRDFCYALMLCSSALFFAILSTGVWYGLTVLIWLTKSKGKGEIMISWSVREEKDQKYKWPFVVFHS